MEWGFPLPPRRGGAWPASASFGGPVAVSGASGPVAVTTDDPWRRPGCLPARVDAGGAQGEQAGLAPGVAADASGFGEQRSRAQSPRRSCRRRPDRARRALPGPVPVTAPDSAMHRSCGRAGEAGFVRVLDGVDGATSVPVATPGRRGRSAAAVSRRRPRGTPRSSTTSTDTRSRGGRSCRRRGRGTRRRSSRSTARSASLASARLGLIAAEPGPGGR